MFNSETAEPCVMKIGSFQAGNRNDFYPHSTFWIEKFWPWKRCKRLKAEERLLLLCFLSFGPILWSIMSTIFYHLSFSNTMSKSLDVGSMSEQKTEKLHRTCNRTEQRWRRKKHERNIFAEWHLGSYALLCK